MNTHFHLPLSLTTFLPIFGYPKIDEARHCTFEMYFTPFPRREIIISNSIFSATRVYLLFIVGRSNMVRAVDRPTHGRAAAPWKQSILASHPRILSISILARSITRVQQSLGRVTPRCESVRVTKSHSTRNWSLWSRKGRVDNILLRLCTKDFSRIVHVRVLSRRSQAWRRPASCKTTLGHAHAFAGQRQVPLER